MWAAAKGVPTCVKNTIRSIRRKQRKTSNLRNGDIAVKEDDSGCEYYSFTPTLSITNPCRKK
jgi:hypothetical protein